MATATARMSDKQAPGGAAPAAAAVAGTREAQEAIDLFQRLRVDEIRAMEKAKRDEIDEKQEELRQLVGARYRDLIDSADTIVQMKANAEQVVGVVDRLQGMCGRLRAGMGSDGGASDAVLREREQHRRVYQLGLRVKVLVDAPSLLWSCLDSHRLFEASVFYVVAQVIHGGLTGGGSTHTDTFPFLLDQWERIARFPALVVERANALVLRTDFSLDQVCGALCSLTLLQNTSAMAVLELFLRARHECLKRALLDTQSSSEATTATTAALASILQSSVHDVCTMFLPAPHDTSAHAPLFFAKLRRLMGATREVVEECVRGLNPSNPHASLSGHALEVVPVRLSRGLSEHLLALPVETVQLKVTNWVRQCATDIAEHGEALLGGLRSAQELAHVEQIVREQTCEARFTAVGVLEPADDTPLHTWADVCGHALVHRIDLWDELFHGIFLRRAQHVISAAFASLHVADTLDAYLARVADGSERVTVQLWLGRHYEPWKVAENEGGAKGAAGAHDDEAGGATRPNGLTDAQWDVLCDAERELRTIATDMDHLLESGANAASRGDLTKHLQVSCSDAMHAWLEHVAARVDALAAAMAAAEVRDGMCLDVAVAQAVAIGRVCLRMYAHCPSLERVLGGSTHAAALRTRLGDVGEKAFEVWASVAARELVRSVQQHVEAGTWRLTSTSALWASTTLRSTDASEAASAEQELRVPTQASSFVHMLLYRACDELNRVGAHTVEHRVVKRFVRLLAEALHKVYTLYHARVKGGSAAETRDVALQVWLDLHVALGVLGADDSGGGGGGGVGTGAAAMKDVVWKHKVTSLLGQYRGLVDPIDWALYEPKLRASSAALLRSSAVLYGALRPGAGAPAGVGAASSAAPGAHNVLPMAPRAARFAYLPVGAPVADAFEMDGARGGRARRGGGANMFAHVGDGRYGSPPPQRPLIH